MFINSGIIFSNLCSSEHLIKIQYRLLYTGLIISVKYFIKQIQPKVQPFFKNGNFFSIREKVKELQTVKY